SYYALLTTLLIMLVSWPIVAFIALARLIMRIIVINKASRTFKERKIWFFSLFFDILSPFVSTILYITTTRKGKKTKTWK
ncbi:MAG: hypothetical protein MUP53_05745, partial [Bacteroidales bacterium]|nr:hypothetical protein [Bacteroidales bacterium]